MDFVRSETSFGAACGEGTIHARLWLPDEPRCVLQVCHGMAEHLGRYDDLASYLAGLGVLVCGIDQMGHGKGLDDGQTPGYFGARHGWECALRDVLALRGMVVAEHPDLPRFLFGHSMGSFLARCLAAKEPMAFDAHLWAGTAGPRKALRLALFLAWCATKFGDPKRPNPLLHALSFGSCNRRMKPARTDFDWLSRDPAAVDAYRADPKCGFLFTSAGFHDLFRALAFLQDGEWARQVPDAPILLYSGDHDPVGGFGAGVQRVAARLAATGHRNVTFRLFPGGRHEMHNELNRAEVYAFLGGWLFQTAAKIRPQEAGKGSGAGREETTNPEKSDA